jgi:hypothetical protein
MILQIETDLVELLPDIVMRRGTSHRQLWNAGSTGQM